MKIGDHTIPQITQLRYPGFIIQNNRKIEGDVNHKVDEMEVFWVLSVIEKLALELKAKVHHTAI